MSAMRVGSHVDSASVSVGTSAAIIKAARTARRSITVQNTHASNALYLGNNPNVTTANGLRVAAGASRTFDNYNGDLYGIASGASTGARYFEVFA